MTVDKMKLVDCSNINDFLTFFFPPLLEGAAGIFAFHNNVAWRLDKIVRIIVWEFCVENVKDFCL